VAIDLIDVFQRGSAGLIDFLHYCVFSRQLEPVFVFLVNEYQNQPTPGRALALYDLFCAPGAPAMIQAEPVLPPLDWRIHRSIQPIRQQWNRADSTPSKTEEDPQPHDSPLTTPHPLPAQYLFDFIVHHLMDNGDGPLHTVSRQFDPGRSPMDNLTNGTMTPGQRAFVENVWKPTVRPQLIAAGFWRIADIGG
jgi:hypothetical protein